MEFLDGLAEGVPLRVLSAEAGDGQVRDTRAVSCLTSAQHPHLGEG